MAAASRFGPTVKRNTGALSASQRRLSCNATQLAGQSLMRSSSSGLIRRHSIETSEPSGSRKPPSADDVRSLPRQRTVGDSPAAAPSPSKSAGLCHLCGGALMETGGAMVSCSGCNTLSLKGGRKSHIVASYEEAVARKEERSMSKEKAPDPFALTPGAALGPVNERGAWRRLSLRKDGEIEGDVENPSRPEKIMAGFIDTGYTVGDRVKSKFHVSAGATSECLGNGWDPLKGQTNIGSVIGQGYKVGEVLVKFDYGDVVASMKMHQIEHADAKAPVSNVERTVNRRRASRSATRSITVGG